MFLQGGYFYVYCIPRGQVMVEHCLDDKSENNAQKSRWARAIQILVDIVNF